jgi:endogenous inhibitor of DNA gyrase (YacG/DUF329 family)
MTSAEKEEIDTLRMQGLGYKTIAKELLLTVDMVKGYCKRHHLNGLAAALQVNAKVIKEGCSLCLQCENSIQQKNYGRTKKFCSAVCRHTWWNENQDKRSKNAIAIYQYTCAHCGKQCSSYGNKQRKYCSHDCYIKSRFWSKEDGTS